MKIRNIKTRVYPRIARLNGYDEIRRMHQDYAHYAESDLPKVACFLGSLRGVVSGWLWDTVRRPLRPAVLDMYLWLRDHNASMYAILVHQIDADDHAGAVRTLLSTMLMVPHTPARLRRSAVYALVRWRRDGHWAINIKLLYELWCEHPSYGPPVEELAG